MATTAANKVAGAEDADQASAQSDEPATRAGVARSHTFTYKVTESGEMYSIDDETSIGLMYLPGNGAFLQVSVLDNRLPAAESTPEEQVQAFLTQLDTTLDGSWEQTTTEDGLEYKHTSGVLRVVRYAPDEVDFALCVTLDPDVYGGLDTLSNVVIGPDGTIYTPGGEYGTF